MYLLLALATHLSCLPTLPKDGTFPDGWESAIDGNGKRYFIDHNTKTTTYNDPRNIAEDVKPVLPVFPESATTDDVLASNGFREVDIEGQVYIVTGGSSGIGLSKGCVFHRVCIPPT